MSDTPPPRRPAPTPDQAAVLPRRPAPPAGGPEPDRPAAGAARHHVRRLAVTGRELARRRIAALLRGDPDRLVADALRRSRLTVNFHPDRVTAHGCTVAEGLLADGRYRNQFCTGISNGGLTAYPGGDRDRWEQRMFDDAYQRPGVTADDRPVYGGLDLAGHTDGASPRFGSCYLQLRADVLSRATFCHGDSVTEPTVVGTADVFEPILAAVLTDVDTTGTALGVTADDPVAWWGRLASAMQPGPGRCLDDYVEAQLHGGLDLRRDVAVVVADPSLRGTGSGDVLTELTARYGLTLRWHTGFSLAPAAVPDDLRGPVAPALAAHLADRYAVATLDAAVLGRAAAAVVAAPGQWSDFGDTAQVLQQLKYLWHILVLRGGPYPR
jgi:hypothetical protein